MGTAELGSLLSRNDRYRIVDAVAGTSTPVHIDDLADRVARMAAADAKLTPSKHTDVQQLRTRFHHVDVPVLAARDILEYQPESKQVRRGPAFEEARAAYHRSTSVAGDRSV